MAGGYHRVSYLWKSVAEPTAWPVCLLLAAAIGAACSSGGRGGDDASGDLTRQETLATDGMDAAGEIRPPDSVPGDEYVDGAADASSDLRPDLYGEGLVDLGDDLSSKPDLLDAVQIDLADDSDLHPEDVETETQEPVVPPDSVVLVLDGASQHVIVLHQGASASEHTAAQELQGHLEQVTGLVLPIVTEPVAPGVPTITLGMGAWAQSLGVAPTPEQLGDQGYLLKTVGPHLVIAGTPQAGTLYGVHRVLEEYVGVRWFAPGATRIPHKSLVFVPPIEQVVQPAFHWRTVYYAWPGADTAFLARQADNNGGAAADADWGIEYSNDGQAHSYFWYLNPDEFFDTHPEYFAEIGGVRVRDETQLCLTNPEVLDIVADRMLQRMAANPQASQHNFSQMDRYNYCQCDQCRAMNELFGTAGGTQFWFVSELAKRTAEVYPHKMVGTLAYMYTEEPPVGLELHSNVAVWLCHMYPSCDSHPIATCPHNARYKERAEAWSALTQHLYIWHYIVDFSHYYNPFPNFGAMSEDMKFYRDIGVEGIFLQGMGQSGGGGEWSLLRPYYGARLLWNPDLDPAVVLKDFLKGYYGAAWKPLWEYVQLLQNKVDGDDVHMHLYTNPGQGYLPDEIMAQSMTLFDQAENAVASDAELLERVAVARMPLVYARMFPRNGYSFNEDKLHWEGEFPTTGEFMGFLNRMKAHGFQLVREVGGDTSLLLLLFSIFKSDVQMAVLDNGVLRVEVVPTLGSRTLRIVHKATGQEVTANNVVSALFFPFAGGVEDRIGGQLEAYGWVEPATLAEADETSVTVTQKTLNGYQVERVTTLEPGSNTVTFHTTLRNDNPTARDDRFRFHAEWNLGELLQTSVWFTDLAGNQVTPSIPTVLDGEREGQYFYELDAPDGSWNFSGPKGVVVTQAWDPADFEHAWLYSYPAVHNELEAEIWTAKLHLEPGQSRTFSHSITVVLAQ